MGVHHVHKTRGSSVWQDLRGGCRNQKVQVLARLVREGALDPSIRARPRKGPGFNWGGMDGSGTPERQPQLQSAGLPPPSHCLCLPSSLPYGDSGGTRGPEQTKRVE